MELSDFTLQSIAFRVLALLIIAGVHGAIIAGAAVFLGDKGPKYDGRLTIVPSNHIDLVGAISLVIFGLGWAKPMAIDAQQFRIGRIGIASLSSWPASPACLSRPRFSTPLILPALTTLPAHSRADDGRIPPGR